MQLHARLIRDASHQRLDLALPLHADLLALDPARHALVVAAHNVQILELALELLHHRADLLEIHALQRLVHAPHRLRHALRDGAHGDGRLHAGGDGVDARGEREEVDALLGVADGVAGVEAGDLRLRRGLCEGFLELGLFGFGVAVRFGGLSV